MTGATFENYLREGARAQTTADRWVRRPVPRARDVRASDEFSVLEGTGNDYRGGGGVGR